MKTKSIIGAILLTSFFIGCNAQNEKGEADFPELTGPYLGQNPPGMRPELFAPGIISCGTYDYHGTFSPDGKEFYFGRQIGRALVWFTEEKNGKWTKPQIAPFYGKIKWHDRAAMFSPDGNKIFFTSYRPKDGSDERLGSSNIYYIERLDEGWSKPIDPGQNINTDITEANGSMDLEGNYYFNSRRTNGVGSNDIYYSNYKNETFGEAQLLSDSVNTIESETYPFIAPDSSYLLFTRVIRGGKYGFTIEIFISFKTTEGQWTKAKSMAEVLNCDYRDSAPFVSFDGKYLFFTRYKKAQKFDKNTHHTYQELMEIFDSPENTIHHGDIYWVDAKIIEQFKFDNIEQ